MKKFLLPLLCFLCGFNANAQNDYRKISYGAKAGLNLSSITATDVKDLSSDAQVILNNIDASGITAGFFISGHVNFSFTQYIGLQPELLFSMQGGRSKHTTATTTTRLNYLSIPVLLDIKVIPGLSLMVGPQFGFNVYRKGTVLSETFSGSDYSDALKQQGLSFNTFDIAAAIGAQYLFQNNFLVSARYTMSLNPIVRSSNNNLEIDGGGNRVWQLGIGYQF